jgi:alcohol dehydrogenase class IV
MLPAALRVNREVRRAEMAYLASMLLDDHFASEETGAEALVALVEGLCGRLGIPQRLSQLGVRPDQLPDLVHSSHGNSLDGNPRDVSDEELYRLLEEIL